MSVCGVMTIRICAVLYQFEFQCYANLNLNLCCVIPTRIRIRAITNHLKGKLCDFNPTSNCYSNRYSNSYTDPCSNPCSRPTRRNTLNPSYRGFPPARALFGMPEVLRCVPAHPSRVSTSALFLLLPPTPGVSLCVSVLRGRAFLFALCLHVSVCPLRFICICHRVSHSHLLPQNALPWI